MLGYKLKKKIKLKLGKETNNITYNDLQEKNRISYINEIKNNTYLMILLPEYLSISWSWNRMSILC